MGNRCMSACCAPIRNKRKTRKGSESLSQPLVRADELELRSSFWRVGESAALLYSLPLLGDHPQGFISIPGDP